VTTEQMDRRGESLNKLHTLLDTRKETLSLYTQLAGMRPFQSNQDMQAALQEFCQTLVDYTATAHFQLYQYIVAGNERRGGVKQIADKVYPSISSLTESILDFNEKYDCEECENLANLLTRLDTDLSKLGEILADRITLEDQIISAYSANAVTSH